MTDNLKNISNSNQPYVIIVIPCYDEAARLDTDQLINFQLPEYRLEFLFVNDGSRDTTLQLLENIRAAATLTQVNILDLPANGGKAEAVRQGFMCAFEKAPDFIGFWDADLATPLDEIARFCNILNTQPAIDMVFGARVQLLGRTIERKFYRHYFGRVFATAVSIALNLPIYDSQCGAKLFRVSPIAQRVFADPFLSRWVFDVEIIARFKKMLAAEGIEVAPKIYELPLYRWRDIHGSKLRLIDGFRAYIDLAKIYRAYLQKIPPK